MTTRIAITIGNRELTFETGHLAKLSNGAVTVQYGETIVLAAADAASEPQPDIDFLPLTIDYRERMYAAGKIPGGFFKREGRPSEREVLTSRLIDRPIRSLFGKGYYNNVQIMATVFSADGINVPDVLAMNASAAALAVSSIPFQALMGAVRVGWINNEFVANPTYEQFDASQLDLVVAATREEIVMVECGAKEVSEEIFIEGLRFAHKHITEIIGAIEELKKKAGKPKEAVEQKEIPSATRTKVESIAKGALAELNQPQKKEERAEQRDQLWNSVLAAFDKTSPDYNEMSIKAAFDDLEYQSVRSLVLEKKLRPDGRSFDEIRPLGCQVGVLPRTHGSALFARGQTQSLGVVTLGTGDDEQKIDALEGEEFKHFMLHYNFPAFSVGEVRPNRGVGRREVGHGALAERAIRAVLPSKELFPYTIRLVSDILESNGSSSMATVCSCTLALLDAGVPIVRPVAGIAIGLFKKDSNYAVLTDIAGLEDHLGDMDFKVAGTTQGITAVQVDLKISGISYEIIQKAVVQAKKARHEILDFMAKTIHQPRTELSKYAPRFTVIKINPEKIKNVIGPSGKVIKEITKETGVKIDIEDDGKVSVFSSDPASSEKAIEWIRSLTAEAEVGKVYKGKVKRIMNFGAFCEILAGVEGLVHVSELADGYVPRVDDVVSIGDEFPVKVIEIDELGRVNLSAKQAGAQLKIKQPQAAAVGASQEREHRSMRPPSRPRPPHHGHREKPRHHGGEHHQSDRHDRPAGPRRDSDD